MQKSAPLALHPAAIERHHGRDKLTRAVVPDEAVTGLTKAVAAAHGASTRLLEAAATLEADSTLTPAARAAELRRLALKLGQAHAPIIDMASRRARLVIEALNETTKPSAPRDAVAAEIRARLASMPDAERVAVIEKALVGKDATIIGSVMGASPFLSGVDEAHISMVETRWRALHHPEAAERTGRLTKALDDAGRAGGAFLGFVEGFVSDPAAKRAEADAAATRSAMSAVIGGDE